MPDFSYSQLNNVNNSSTAGYDKILAKYYRSFDNTIRGRSERCSISFKNSVSFYDSISATSRDSYQHSAGADLSTIFYPYQSKIANASGINMPCLASGVLPTYSKPHALGINYSSPNNPSGLGIRTANLLPFYWEYHGNRSTYFIDRANSASSGDALSSVVNSDVYSGNVDRFRDPYDIRGIGLRLPQMAVGWGYTATHGHPWPSGSTQRTFAGNVEEGYLVSPDNYVAAPIDLRYDSDRHVWSAPKGFWAEVQSVSVSSSGAKYTWREVVPQVSGGWFTPIQHPGRVGGNDTTNPLFEINNIGTIPSGQVVWVPPRERSDSYFFDSHKNNDEFWSLIRGSTPVTSGVWKYSWQHVYLGATASGIQIVSSGILGAPSNSSYAFNIAEFGNSPHNTILGGIDTNGAAYPTNFKIKPIGGGGTGVNHQVDVLVKMWRETTPSGTYLYLFDRLNTHDGTC